MQKFSTVSTFMDSLPVATMKKLKIMLYKNVYLKDIDNVL